MLKSPVGVGLECQDLEVQRRFYRDTLGLREIRAGAGFVWFELNGRLLELLAKSGPPRNDHRRASLAFEVADIRAAWTKFLARGVRPVTDIQCSDGARQYSACFKDAEENLFEVVQRLA
jgi:catechol 2,3-dioxygenase-like lactoylglutathione lyase family enzyme